MASTLPFNTAFRKPSGLHHWPDERLEVTISGLMNQHSIRSAERSAQGRPASLTLWRRAARLRCPACGRAPIFRGWFTMHEACAACGRRFRRAPGYLLGSIYFNYGVTAMLMIALYFAMFFGDLLSDPQRLVVLSLFAAGFAAWFFRYARALWIAFDERWDPWPNEEEARQLQSGSQRGTGNC
jgi:uncharacterized protein (DUF983 family)